jgi:hypothetical protein
MSVPVSDNVSPKSSNLFPNNDASSQLNPNVPSHIKTPLIYQYHLTPFNETDELAE